MGSAPAGSASSDATTGDSPTPEPVPSRNAPADQPETAPGPVATVSAEHQSGAEELSGTERPAGDEQKVQTSAAGKGPAVPEDNKTTPSALAEDASAKDAGDQMGTGDSASEADPAGTLVLGEERFAIQLIGFRSESSVAPFVEEFGLTDTARFMQSTNEGQDWYLVLIGDYETREKGRAAVATLPERLRELEPWVRPLPAGTRLRSIDAFSAR
jgi:septal ring-binding cell division protein DamX